MLTIVIDRGAQLRKGHAALTGDLLQTVPKLGFEADARLVACNNNRALRNRRLHGFSPPRISPRYYMTVWLFGQENPRLGATGGFPAEAVSRLDVRQNCYWRSLTLPSSASRLNLGCSMMPSLTLRR